MSSFTDSFALTHRLSCCLHCCYLFFFFLPPTSGERNLHACALFSWCYLAARCLFCVQHGAPFGRLLFLKEERRKHSYFSSAPILPTLKHTGKLCLSIKRGIFSLALKFCFSYLDEVNSTTACHHLFHCFSEHSAFLTMRD